MCNICWWRSVIINWAKDRHITCFFMGVTAARSKTNLAGGDMWDYVQPSSDRRTGFFLGGGG